MANRPQTGAFALTQKGHLLKIQTLDQRNQNCRPKPQQWTPCGWLADTTNDRSYREFLNLKTSVLQVKHRFGLPHGIFHPKIEKLDILFENDAPQFHEASKIWLTQLPDRVCRLGVQTGAL